MIEVRFFGKLQNYAVKKGWSLPYYFPLEQECTAAELALLLELPLEEIEGVFVDGVAYPLESGRVKPGQRLAFVPYGIPGPYRVMFGLK